MRVVRPPDGIGGQAVQEADKPGLGEMTAVFARIGLVSFGGPAGQIALMHRVLVDEKRWMDEARFLHALNYCMLLPGPEAMQLATYSGWLLHGTRGGLIAGLLFLMPGALVLVALSIVYLLAGDVSVVQGLLFGRKAAVLAVVLEALLKVSKRALHTPADVMTALFSLLAIALLKVPFPVVIIAAMGIGMLGYMFSRNRGQEAHHASMAAPPLAQLFTTLSLWLAIWLGPLALLYLTLGAGHVFTQEGGFFSIMAAVTFGGAYAVLAWVAQQAVEVYGWLQPDEMLTGLGLAETTPGPLILVLVFVGFLGGARLSGLDPVIGGLGGAMGALWFTFVPSFMFIFAGAPYLEKLREVRWLSAALGSVTAAVVGIIANLALWFGLHVLFGEVQTVTAGPLEVPVPVLASVDAASLLISAAAVVALSVMRMNMIAVLGMAAIIGILISALG